MRCHPWRSVLLGAMTLGPGVVGCKQAPKIRPAWAGDSFIAMERDFQEFREWERIDLAGQGQQGLVHTAGPRKIYISGRSAPGLKAVPVGTIIVKEIEGAPKDHQIFAMVKRGGDYNPIGAPGWEWFELRDRKDRSLAIVWRGFNPPIGEGYGSDINGGCNGCHAQGRQNDFLRTPQLSLAAR